MNKKTVLITGAGIGIGHATALQFAQAGYHVIITDILEQESIKLVDTIRQQGGQSDYFYLDVRSTSDVEALCSKVASQFGGLTTVVNNAGIAHKQPLDTLTDDQWDLTLDVDLKGMMRVARASVGLLEQNDNSSIVCLSSIAGANVGWAERVPYSAAKGGITGLVKGLAIELASKNIRVNGVAPGLIRTAQSMSTEHSVGPEGLATMEPNVPLGRIGTPGDIAGVIKFLASEQAAYITGQTIVVDGGLTVAL